MQCPHVPSCPSKNSSPSTKFWELVESSQTVCRFPALCHLWPILATISLFSSPKPPKWPIRSRTLWLGLHLRSYLHSCRLPSNPSVARIQHHCDLSWPLIYLLMRLWRTEKQRRKAGEGVRISWVCAENSNLSNRLNHPEASRSRVKPAGEWSRSSAQTWSQAIVDADAGPTTYKVCILGCTFTLSGPWLAHSFSEGDVKIHELIITAC